MRRFAQAAVLLLTSFAAAPVTARLLGIKKRLSLHSSSLAQQETQTSHKKSVIEDDSENPVRRAQGGGTIGGLPITGADKCGIPSFEGDWIESNPEYPRNVAESQGGMIGNHLLIVSGFNDRWGKVTKEVYKLDTTKDEPAWVQQDDIIASDGVSHTGFVIVQDRFYMCGAYIGPNPGPNDDGCYVFDNSIEPGNGQWTALPKLPDGGRGGGGLSYIHQANSLLYAGGATREGWHVEDFNDAWILNLDDLPAGWIRTTNKPFASNHLSAVTAKDGAGKWRIFYMGGQQLDDEGESENAYVYEFVYNSTGEDQWFRRQDMPMTRGHASSSTNKYGCGFVIIGGTSTQNGGRKLSDISYYDIDKDTWMKIGDLPGRINTPVCDFSLDVNGEDWLYCESGHVSGRFSYRRKINTGVP